MPGPPVDLAAGLVRDVLANALANLFCLGTPVLLAVLVYRLRGRRRLRRFFGIGRGGAGVVQIRLSNLHVKPSGTLGPLRIGTGFVGSAIIAAEYEYAIELVRAIQSRPLARVLRTLAEQFGVREIDPPVVCRIDRSLDCVPASASAAPQTHRPVDFAADAALVADIRHLLGRGRCFVLVGSPVYNVLTHYVLANCDDQSRVAFVQSPQEPGHEASALLIRNFHHTGADEVFARRVTDLGGGVHAYEEYFVVQKITDWNRTGTTIFVCAGNSVSATAAALGKLANWRSLADEFGVDPFVTVYLLRTADRELTVTGADGSAGLGSVTRVWPPES
jgi:hypothetical protein